MKLLIFSGRFQYLRPFILTSGLILLVLALLVPATAEAVTADVVMMDQALVFNRLGAQNVNGVIYALKRDVQTIDANAGFLVDDDTGEFLVPFEACTVGVTPSAGTTCQASDAGNIQLRPDKRPRPLVLRVNAGDNLTVNFTNLLAPQANPDPPLREEGNENLEPLGPNDQVAGRFAGFHPQGLELVGSIDSDSSYVGNNPSSLTAPGQSRTYTFRAVREGTFLVTSTGAVFGGEASGGNPGVGAFAAVNVEPPGATWYRSQVTEEELRLAINDSSANSCSNPSTPGYTCDGHPIVNYNATYPTDEPWITEGKSELPILNMVHNGKIVHSDLNAIIAGPVDGKFLQSAYAGGYNPTVPNRLEPFREFTVIFHDEQAATQAFPGWFSENINPVIAHTMHGVRDSFMINYGSGGIGSEIVANRLGVGPMHDCLDCAYEEFFLSSYAVGDPAMLVDVPANIGLENCTLDAQEQGALVNCDPAEFGPKATRAFYPDDPSNVHHSYTSDFVKFRNLHAGPKEQHIFHLHNHQWLFNADDDNSNYLDAQGLGPGSGYTYEINFGGSGNRNKTAGDAIFHCHFYPHFAQGMWSLFRVHDTMEVGTVLDVTPHDGTGIPTGYHTAAWDLKDGSPALVDPTNVSLGTVARALPDGEILAGTPIPAVVPLPGKPMPVMPGKVTMVTKDADGDGNPESSQALVDRTDVYPAGHPLAGKIKNPGYPFWLAPIEDTVGQRPTTPPLDMITPDEATALVASADPLWDHPGFVTAAGGHNGGLPRHTLEGYAAGGASVDTQNRLDFSKKVTVAKPVYFPEEGTDVEQAAMAFHAERYHDTFLPDGTAATGDSGFVTNGAKPVPGAPYQEPCLDDQGDLFTGTGQFFGGTSGSFFDSPTAAFHADNPRVYKAANIQIDAVFNKVGYHFPQQRMIALWQDAIPIIDKAKPPEPFIIRMNTFDCTQYYHTNLIPKDYELDDYQVRTPTDITGQHIHLPKWDLTTADGAANGWNYEDGTLSPGAVVERIHAINAWNDLSTTTPVLSGQENTAGHLEPSTEHPFAPFRNGERQGARVTTQRWFADPVINRQQYDRGLGIIFTHDHYGPSTHQQIGLYATVLTEPAGSLWKHNETGVALATRDDGGPTSWQAIIEPGASGGPGLPESGEPYREFFLQYSDFQSAYEAGVYIGAGPDGRPNGVLPDANSFRSAINPSFRQEPGNPLVAGDEFPDIVRFPPTCPGGVPRPCPEAISADDPGMLVVNYRNEPVGLRVFDPLKAGPDGKPGTQSDGLAGDLAYALQTRTDRAIPEMNVQPTGATDINGTVFPPPINSGDVGPGDPFTPMIRVYSGDLVRVKIQSGGHEHEHNASIHGVKWLQGGSGHGSSPNSGWRNSQSDGISEQFNFNAPINADLRQLSPFNSPCTVDDSCVAAFAADFGRTDCAPGDDCELDSEPDGDVDGLDLPALVAGLNKIGAVDYAWAVDASQDGWWSGMWGLMRNYMGPRADLAPLSETAFLSDLDIVNRRDFRDGVCPIDAPVRNFDISVVAANDVLGKPDGVVIIPAGAAATMHEGAQPNPEGGTLVYNPRDTVAQFQGPLHDPTAMMYVMTADLEPVDPLDIECANGGALNPDCIVKLKDGAPIEPLVMRAAAGDCISVTLRNRLPEVAYDLAGYNTFLQMVIRDRNDPQGQTTFQGNLVRPSSHVGLHAQLVEYDVSRSDGANVGINPEQTAPPTGLSRQQTYTWYAGHLELVKIGSTSGRIDAYPVEFGGVNLQPADKIKQGHKGLVGSLIIEPEGSTWTCAIKTVQPSRTLPARGGPSPRTAMTPVRRPSTTAPNRRGSALA